MSKVVRAMMNRQNNVESMNPLPKLKRAFATVCSEELRVPEIALLSDVVLVQDVYLSEEDAVGSHLSSE